MERYMDGADDVLREYDMLVDVAASAVSLAASAGDEVRAAYESARASEAARLLGRMDVGRVNDGARGIRVSALRSAGYRTVADLVTRADGLCRVPGIGPDGVRRIGESVGSLRASAEASARVRIDADSPGGPGLRLLRSVRALRIARGLDRDGRDVADALGRVSADADALRSMPSRMGWLLAGARRRSMLRRAYESVRSTVDYLADRVADLGIRVGSASSVLDSEALADYMSDPASFWAVLGSVADVPDGQAGGLPDELAREVREQPLDTTMMRAVLRPYQEFGARYALRQRRVLIGDEMGLGKTMEAIAVMAHLARSGRVHAMVVCPVALVTNWCREVSRHSSLEALCAHGGRRDAAISRWYAMGGVLVTNYETLCGVGPAAFTGVDVLAVDEAHYVKNPDAMRTRAVADLASRCGYVMLMSGTPMENRVDEMVSIVRMLSPGTADRLALDSRMRDAVAFRDDAAPVYLRRTQEDVLTELPEKEESEQWCALGEEERSSYEDAVRSGSFPRMRRVSWEMPDLRMSAKAMRLSGICEDAEREGRKVIVFSYFLDTVDKAACLLGRRCVGVIRGDVGGRARQDAVDALDAAAPGSAIVCQIGAGGVGLNVQCASVVVICEPQLKPSIESQAIARAHRMGQARTVMVYRLLAEGTVDERIVGMLRSKQDEFDRYADESTMGDASLGRSDERGIVQAEMDRLAA